jgi:uncharacterized membrane protein
MKSNDLIRRETKVQLSGNYGQGILATMVPGIIVGIANMIIGTLIGQSYVISLIVSVGFSIITTFMVAKMSLNLAHGAKNAGFDESLSPGESLLNVMYYVIIMQVISLLITLPINKIFFDAWIVSEDTFSNLIQNFQGSSPELLGFIWGYVGSMVLVVILLMFITYKIIYVAFIIIDQKVGVKEAFTKSFIYTKGNFFRIIGMNLFFIGWYFLSVPTCGLLLFYVIPYETLSRTNLYLEIRIENGDATGRDFDQVSNTETKEEVDPFETREYNKY